VFQNIVELDGERVVSAEQTIGYIHRAFEKLPNEGRSTKLLLSPTDLITAHRQ
jgi:NADH:ubiquinone oxidoreductase subunit D